MCAETAMDTSSSPRKRLFEEVDNDKYDHHRKVKTERSWSNGSSSSHTTAKSSIGVKMEIDDHHAIDEETTNAASILNGVSMDHRTVHSSESHAN